MRKIILKIITSQNHRRRKLMMEEIVSEGNLMGIATKSYSYCIIGNGNITIDNIINTKIRFNAQILAGHPHRTFMKQGIDINKGWVFKGYRVVGRFAVIINNKNFIVCFLHGVNFKASV